MSNYYEGLPKETHSVRLSQIISTFGSGAIVDFRDQTLMTAAPKYWRKTNVIHDERLAKRLKVDEFRIHADLESGVGVPFVRFPGWYFCPKCRKFQHISKWEEEYKPKRKDSSEYMRSPKCMDCNISLVSVSILVACENGHIDDFPWIEWIHHKDNKIICNNPKLKIVSNSGTLGLEGFRVECSCGASASLRGAFHKNAFKNIKGKYGGKFKCSGYMPWKNKKEECDSNPRAVLRNALNVYFPKIESSIVIPPYADELNVLIENSEEYKSLLSAKRKKEKKGTLDKFLKEDLEDYIRDIADEIKQVDNIEAIEKIIKRKLSPDEESVDIVDKNKYREEEYDALLGKIKESSFKSKDFKIETKDISKYKIDELSSVTLVKKLREVRALIGYTRLNPPEQHVMGLGQNMGKSKLVNIKDPKDNWYPAYEVRGEGIFIELKSDLINSWEGKNCEVKDRAKQLNKKYNKDKPVESIRIITPKFILLHTLAHVLIRELSFECGYAVTSLRERIYCDLPGEEKKMSGILIYTADSDSEGSLGGLVKQGNPEFFTKIMKNAISKAKWCSADPVCINSNGQGRDSLNLAACHNCVLLPETSCEEFNVLLDRCMLVGNVKNRNFGFFSKYV